MRVADRMDQLITAAVRQHFQVWQNERGVWLFRRGSITITAKRTPESPREWITLINTLKGAGLDFPPGE